LSPPVDGAAAEPPLHAAHIVSATRELAYFAKPADFINVLLLFE
jgi:hypothetical protein